MDIIYYLSILLIILGLSILIPGLIKPTWAGWAFKNKSSSELTRKLILSAAVPMLLISGTVLSMTEPASVRDERTNSEKAALIADQEAERKFIEEQKAKTKQLEKERQQAEDARKKAEIEKTEAEAKKKAAEEERNKTEQAARVADEQMARAQKLSPDSPTQNSTTNNTSPAPAPAQDQQSSVYYRNCTAARNAVAAPIYRGQPGYGTHLDRDRDDIACE